MSDQVRVELESGQVVELSHAADESPGSLAELLGKHGLPLNLRCGQRGLCKGCEVVIQEGAIHVDGKTVGAPETIRSCKATVAGHVRILVPSRSRIEHKPQVGETFEIAVPFAHQPLFELKPGVQDTGFAVDIGTTTVVVLLIDLARGEPIARAGGFNEQIRFGDNVLTRIDQARNPETLRTLQSLVVMETIAPLLARACERAGRSMDRLAGGTIAGNTTMLHLLVGEDPSPIGVAPFQPRFCEARRVSSESIQLTGAGLDPQTPIQLLPSIAGFIGADITAGVYASGMVFDPFPSLFVDIGTNGEIVLQNGQRLTACATAAGPAFEGCGLSCGTRAREGAVSDVRLGMDPFLLEVETIGQLSLDQANGLCGSAYIDFLAQARACGLLGEAGRFNGTQWDKLPGEYRDEDHHQRAITLRPHSSALRVSELDVALLLQAKAAIGAGIETLLDTAGLTSAEIGRVYLAGGFGMHLDIPHAIAVGLLPGFKPEQVRVVGNTSLAGAMLALVDCNTLQEMESIRSQVEVIELNLTEGFDDRYVEHLSL